jgi:hypothetical protein
MAAGMAVAWLAQVSTQQEPEALADTLETEGMGALITKGLGATEQGERLAAVVAALTTQGIMITILAVLAVVASGFWALARLVMVAFLILVVVAVAVALQPLAALQDYTVVVAVVMDFSIPQLMDMFLERALLVALVLSALFGAQVAPFHQLTQGMYDVSYCTRKWSTNRLPSSS